MEKYQIVGRTFPPQFHSALQLLLLESARAAAAAASFGSAGDAELRFISPLLI
jgi:hypothetical protein